MTRCSCIASKVTRLRTCDPFLDCSEKPKICIARDAPRLPQSLIGPHQWLRLPFPKMIVNKTRNHFLKNCVIKQTFFALKGNKKLTQRAPRKISAVSRIISVSFNPPAGKPLAFISYNLGEFKNKICEIVIFSA